MMAFSDFINKYGLEKKTTSNIDNQQVLSSLSLNDVGIYLRGGPFSSHIGFVNLHPSKGTHWVCYIHEGYSDRYGIVCPKKLFIFILKKRILFKLRMQDTRSNK